MSKGKSKPKQYFLCKKLFFILGSLLVAIVSYFLYEAFSSPLSIPHVNINQWWGPDELISNQDKSIRPFTVEFTDIIVNDLRTRLMNRRPFTLPLEGAGFAYGFNSAFLTTILDFWKNKYEFKQREYYLNKYKQYITNIQGLDIHYVHVKPEAPENVLVVPVLLLHGWPESVYSFYQLIHILTNYRNGYDYVFEVIAPSLPGCGFSQGAVRPGLGLVETAVVLKNLMDRIGIKNYVVQGGDIGHIIGSVMATLFSNDIIGFHTNYPTVLYQPKTAIKILLGSFWPKLITEEGMEDRLYPLTKHFKRILSEAGHIYMQSTKPDTIGIGLTDSPAGLAAYILDKFASMTNPNYQLASDGELLHKFTLTHLLDNVMTYWISNCITSSMRLYAETLRNIDLLITLDSIPILVPTWGLKFKHELLYTPDSVLRDKYRNYLHTTATTHGGHFAALENPDIMAQDIFKATESFLKYSVKMGNKYTSLDTETDYENTETIYDFTIKDINGNNVKLEKYKGYVLLIVNVASECGLTEKNYKQLNDLHEKYSVRGLKILAFPCNQFNSQEPGSSDDILVFTRLRKVTFEIFEKIKVNGDNAHPLWKFLKYKQPGILGDFIKWNFSKFIVDRNGVPVERLGPNVDPIDLVPLLEKYF